MSRRIKDTIENDVDWKNVAMALVDYHIGTDQCFSSGEIARDMRLYRPELVFAVRELGEYVREQHGNSAFASYDDGFDEVYPVTAQRTTTGSGRTPSGLRVVVYGKTQTDANQHSFEVDIPPPNGLKKAWTG
jgi:hypothetical protein